MNPLNNNVIFCSALHKWSFTLRSFATRYCHQFRGKITPEQLAARLWGNVYFDAESRRFVDHAPDERTPRSFVQFCLEPMYMCWRVMTTSYKLYAQVLGAETPQLASLLSELGIVLKKEQLQMDASPLLKLVMSRFFQSHGGLVDTIVQIVPSPIDGAATKVRRCWEGDATSELGKAMSSCDAKGPLVIHVVKMYPTPDASDFIAFGRVFSGTVAPGMEVDVLGSSFSAENVEDMVHRTISSVGVSQGRYHLTVTRCRAGNWVMLGGLGDAVQGIATVVARNVETAIFHPLEFNTQAVVRLSIEPRKPSELPVMVEALRKVEKSGLREV